MSIEMTARALDVDLLARELGQWRTSSHSGPAYQGLADGIKPIPHTPVPADQLRHEADAPGGGPVFTGPHMLLPADKARHVGEAVAMVVAETSAQAMDAAEAVEVEYEELPFVVHSEDALKPGAPAVWDEIAGQHAVRHHVRRQGQDRPRVRARPPMW